MKVDTITLDSALIDCISLDQVSDVIAVVFQEVMDCASIVPVTFISFVLRVAEG